MGEITVRLLGEADWREYREVRLAALQDAPEAFVARFEDEASYGDEFWHERMVRARRFIAERGDEQVGVVCLGPHGDDRRAAEVFGLWTAPSVRGERVAWELVSAAARKAEGEGHRLLYFWAGSDNAAAIGFASIFGFRPTEERRAVRVADGAVQEDADEVAMVLALTNDPTRSVNPYSG